MAMAELKAEILKYLKDSEGVRVLTGQFGSYGDGTDYATAQDQLDRIAAKTGGVYPAITGMDYAMPGGMDSATKFMIDKWREGYLVHASWHMPNPFTGGGAGVNPESSVNLAQAYTTDTAVNKKFRQQLDTVAFQLAKLRDAGAPVFWRPFHEMNGDWFWWKATGGKAEQFKQLWIYTHNYLTNVKGLNNLMWCFSPNHAWDEWHKMLPSVYYPGNAYVDSVGLDKYASTSERPVKLNTFGDYDDLVKTGKPLLLWEFGGLEASSAGWDVPNAVKWDQIVPQLKTSYPKLVGFQAWEWVWQIAADNATGVKAMFDLPYTIARHELPKWGSVVTPPIDPPDDPPVDPPAPSEDMLSALESTAVNALIDAKLSAFKASLKFNASTTVTLN